jgi:hypothetical protein
MDRTAKGLLTWKIDRLNETVAENKEALRTTLIALSKNFIYTAELIEKNGPYLHFDADSINRDTTWASEYCKRIEAAEKEIKLLKDLLNTIED